MRRAPFAAALAVAAALTPAAALACTCLGKLGDLETEFSQALDGSAAVFVGRVVIVTQPSGEGRDVEVTLDVTESFQGDLSGRTVVGTPDQASACGYRFTEGEEYLVYAYTSPAGGLGTNLCQRTAPAKEAAAELRYLRAGQRPKSPLVLVREIVQCKPCELAAVAKRLGGREASSVPADARRPYFLRAGPLAFGRMAGGRSFVLEAQTSAPICGRKVTRTLCDAVAEDPGTQELSCDNPAEEEIVCDEAATRKVKAGAPEVLVSPSCTWRDLAAPRCSLPKKRGAKPEELDPARVLHCATNLTAKGLVPCVYAPR